MNSPPLSMPNPVIGYGRAASTRPIALITCFESRILIATLIVHPRNTEPSLVLCRFLSGGRIRIDLRNTQQRFASVRSVWPLIV